MHQVNIKKNRVIALRVAAYAVTITLSIITTVILLLIALGYRFNKSGDVIHSGLVLVDNKPEAAQIYINGILEDSSSPGRFVLPIGGYELSLELDGYKGWKKNLDIKKEVVERVDYPLLIPKKLSTETKLSIGSPQMVSQSPNNKLLVHYVAGENVLHITELNPTEPKQTTTILPPAFTRESDSAGSLSVIEWSQNSKKILINQTLSNGANKIVSFDINNPEESINISDRFAQLPLLDVHYQGSKTDIVYGLNQGTLRRYNIETGKTTNVLDGVLSYQPFSDKVVAYTRLSTQTNKVQVGVLNAEDNAVLEQFNDTNIRPVISYGEFDQYDYLAVVTAGEKARVYRDPLNTPILKKQIPFVRLPIESSDFIKFSPNNQYLLIRSADNYVSFDFENARQHSFKVSKQIQPETLRWMNDSHLAYQSIDGQNFLIEFDGKNKMGLLPSNIGNGLYYSSDFRNAFRLHTEVSTVKLELIALTVK